MGSFSSILLTLWETLDEVTAKWQNKYPRTMKRWYDNWDAISPIFKFSNDVRTVIYTTNAIESLNSTYQRLNSQRNDTAIVDLDTPIAELLPLLNHIHDKG